MPHVNLIFNTIFSATILVKFPKIIFWPGSLKNPSNRAAYLKWLSPSSPAHTAHTAVIPGSSSIPVVAAPASAAASAWLHVQRFRVLCGLALTAWELCTRCSPPLASRYDRRFTPAPRCPLNVPFSVCVLQPFCSLTITSPLLRASPAWILLFLKTPRPPQPAELSGTVAMTGHTTSLAVHYSWPYLVSLFIS